MDQPQYSHVQKAPLYLILYGVALVCVGAAWVFGDKAGVWISVCVVLILTAVASSFHHLAVTDLGDRLAVRVGPTPLFGLTGRYSDRVKVEVGRTLILDGWGIHMSIRGGWVWNLWGRDCVVVHLKKGPLRIGTDDAANLAVFLQGKVGG
ncbi:MAG: hypothetical protein NTZ71_16595 [Planctomycetota bacterium]|nr:hypothetical protein [Planctomycetota bacterium]